MDDLPLTDILVLHALNSAGEKGQTRKALHKALPRDCKPPGAGIETAVNGLLERGYIEELPRARKQKTARLVLQSAGRACLSTLLPETLLHAKSRKKAARFIALQRALGLDPKLAGAILAKKDGLVTALLAQRLGMEIRGGTTALDLARRTAAAELQTSDHKTDTLWSALLARAAPPSTSKAADSSNPGTHPSSDDTRHSESNFAEEVRRAAPRAMNGWLGPQKLFIHSAWEVWRQESATHLDLPEFKSHLVQASRSGRLSLARADFTLGLNPRDLAQAETRDGSEVFHFLTIAKEERQ